MDLVVSLGMVLTNVTDPNLPSVPAETLTECIRLCFYSTSCASFFYNHDENLCYRSNMLYTVVPAHNLTVKPNVNCYQWRHDGCPPQWSYSKPTGLCLLLSTSRGNYSVATEKCVENGGRVVNIQNSKENNLIRNIVLELGSVLYIGLKKTSSVWTWHLGENRGDFRSWGDGQPRVGSCAKIDTSDWTSSYCTKNREYLCQIVLNNPYGDC